MRFLTSSFANNIIASWGESKKEYRYLNRTSLSHPKMPIRVDISITKMSNREKEYNIEASQVFQNIEHYENHYHTITFFDLCY